MRCDARQQPAQQSTAESEGTALLVVGMMQCVPEPVKLAKLLGSE